VTTVAQTKRASKRTLRIAAAAGATVAFASPWAALKAAPRPPSPPKIVVQSGAVAHGQSSGGSVTTTRASGARVIH
jgi:hypothetical protein